MDAVRVLEEQGEWMEVSTIAAELATSESVILAALRELFDLEVGTESMFDGVLLIEDEDEQSGQLLPAGAVRVLAERSSNNRRPLHGYGLDLLGRFTYTATETADRLRLIDGALADPSLNAHAGALLSARDKLMQWARHLADTEPAAAS